VNWNRPVKINLLIKYILMYSIHRENILQKIKVLIYRRPLLVNDFARIRNKTCITPIKIACMNYQINHDKLIKLLIHKGADIRLVGTYQKNLNNVVEDVIENRNYHLTKLLIKCISKIYTSLNIKLFDRILHFAIKNRCNDTVKLLLKKGMSPRRKFNTITPLNLTYRRYVKTKNIKYLDIFKLLLEYNANICYFKPTNKISKIIKNEKERRKTLKYRCCKYIKNNRSKWLHTYMKHKTNRDVMKMMNCMRIFS